MERRPDRPVLYTCHLEKKGAAWHPCGIAAKALDEIGFDYRIEHARGNASTPWTWPTRRHDRAEVRALSGKNAVPILVLKDGEVIAGSGRIKRWADAQDAASLPPTLYAEGPART
jgi:glutathione S-transferase